MEATINISGLDALIERVVDEDDTAKSASPARQAIAKEVARAARLPNPYAVPGLDLGKAVEDAHALMRERKEKERAKRAAQGRKRKP